MDSDEDYFEEDDPGYSSEDPEEEEEDALEAALRLLGRGRGGAASQQVGQG